ncbi:hypothetical protein GCM10028798_06920 [Humibacter antri]
MKHQSITSLPPAPAADRGHRMLEYTVMMSIRVLCLISLLWVRGWWILIPAAGAVFLPYFAVVVANVARSKPSEPERPGSIVRMDGVPGAATWEPTDEEAQQSAPEQDREHDRENESRPPHSESEHPEPRQQPGRPRPDEGGRPAQQGRTDQDPPA